MTTLPSSRLWAFLNAFRRILQDVPIVLQLKSPALPRFFLLLSLSWKPSRSEHRLGLHVANMAEVAPQVTVTRPSTNNYPSPSPTTPTVSATNTSSPNGRTGDVAGDGMLSQLPAYKYACSRTVVATALTPSPTVCEHVIL